MLMMADRQATSFPSYENIQEIHTLNRKEINKSTKP
jgi:hypothetical protein